MGVSSIEPRLHVNVFLRQHTMLYRGEQREGIRADSLSAVPPAGRKYIKNIHGQCAGSVYQIETKAVTRLLKPIAPEEVLETRLGVTPYNK